MRLKPVRRVRWRKRVELRFAGVVREAINDQEPAQHLQRLNRLHEREGGFAPSLMAPLPQLHDLENDRNDDSRGLGKIGKIHAR